MYTYKRRPTTSEVSKILKDIWALDRGHDPEDLDEAEDNDRVIFEVYFYPDEDEVWPHFNLCDIVEDFNMEGISVLMVMDTFKYLESVGCVSREAIVEG